MRILGIAQVLVLIIFFACPCVASPSDAAPSPSLLKRCLVGLAKAGGRLLESLAPEEDAPEFTQVERDHLWISERHFKQKLEAATKSLLKTAQGHPKQVPKSLKFKGKEYEVLQYLGGGVGDGTLYLIQTERGPRVLKCFISNERMNDNLSRLEEFRRDGIRTVGIEERDQEQNFAILEYIRGVSVDDVLRYGFEHGFNFEEIEMVRRKYEAHKQIRRARKWPIPDADRHNVFLDIRTGEFVIIDPF